MARIGYHHSQEVVALELERVRVVVEITTFTITAVIAKVVITNY